MADLIVGDLTPRNQYTATNGQTAFTYAFPIFTDADLKVYVGTTLKTLTTDYTVSGAGTDNGGTVTLVTGATTDDIVTVYRDMPVQRTSDYQTNGDLLASTLNDDLDKLAMMIQQVEYDLNNRCLRFGQFTTGIPLSEFTESDTDRADKVLAFDSLGNPNITQELGVYKGADATTTTAAYTTRDLVKATTAGQLDNVYICLQPSPSGTLLTNTAYWALIIDAMAAGTSASAAAASAAAALVSENNAQSSEDDAAADLVLTNADVVLTHADVVLTNADVVSTAADRVATNQDAIDTAADLVATNQDTIDTAADLVLTNADVVSSAANAATATTQATNASASASTATTQASSATASATSATTSATNAGTSETNASASATAAAASATAAALSADTFDDTYLGAKASDPTLDNDGDALTEGDLYFNSGTDRMKVYSGSSWADVAVDSATVVTKTSATGSAALPAGTTAQRDGSPTAGYLRWNSTDTSAEVYDGTAWAAVGGGNSTTEGLYEHANTISANYSITSGNNAGTFGPITIDSGISVTIPSGSVWTIA